MKNIVDFINASYDAYKWLCFLIVTAILLLMAIFGGTVSVKINFNSWNELIQTLKNLKR